LAISVVGGMIMQTVHGYTHFEPGKYFLWYVLPQAFDYTLLAAGPERVLRKMRSPTGVETTLVEGRRVRKQSPP